MRLRGGANRTVDCSTAGRTHRVAPFLTLPGLGRYTSAGRSLAPGGSDRSEETFPGDTVLCYAHKGGVGGAASGLALPGWSLLDSADSLRGGVPRDYRPGVGCDRSLPTPRTVPRLDPPSEPTSSTACFHRVVHSLSTYMHVKLRPKSHFSNFSTPHRIGVKMTKPLETSFCPDSDHQTRTQ